VKVQYPDMEDMFRGDMFTITTVMKCVGYVCLNTLAIKTHSYLVHTQFFPYFQFTWVLPEFAESLKEELGTNP